MGRGYVDPDFPNPGHPNDTDIIIYGYTPSLALACTAAAFFGVMFIASAVSAGLRSVPWAYRLQSIVADTAAGRVVCATLALGLSGATSFAICYFLQPCGIGIRVMKVVQTD